MNTHKLNLNRTRLAVGIAPALLALAAQAQTAANGVQLYGQTSAAVTTRDHTTGGGRLTDVSNNLLAASLLGFRGTEDLGGGMRAVFRLEHGFNMDTGAPTSAAKFWSRQSFVGLNLSPAATVTLGRQFTAGADRAIQSFDVFNLGGTSLAVMPLSLFGVNRFAGNDARADNSVKLRLRGPAGLTGGVSAGLKDTSGRSASMDVAQITDSYTIGAYSIRFRAASPVAEIGALPSHQMWGAGGQMALGPVRLYLHYIDSSLDPTVVGRRTQTNRIIAPAVSWMAHDLLILKAAYTHDEGKNLNGVAGRDGTKRTLVVSAEYFLSKRTALNAAYFSNRFSGGYRLETVNIAALNRDPAASSQQGLSFGIRHVF